MADVSIASTQAIGVATAALPVVPVAAALGSAAAFAFVLDAVKVPAFRYLGLD